MTKSSEMGPRGGSRARGRDPPRSNGRAPPWRSTAGGLAVIELIAVICVTAIVAALAYSAYRTYVVRAQVAEGMAAAHRLQDLVAAAFRNGAGVPAATDEHHSAGDYVESISLENGRIDLVYGNRADATISGRQLSLTPYETASLDVVWVCGNQIPGAGLHPLGFAGGGPQAVQVASTIEARFLPAACR